jgi:microcystin-dependent protein
MPLDFPSNPSDGQVYEDFYFDAATGAWNSNAGTRLPNIFKNVTYTTGDTYLIPLTAKGKLGQTANLQEWQSSDGTVLANIKSDGGVVAPSATLSTLSLSGRLAPESGGVPTGVVSQYVGSTAPTGYLLCQGQAISRSTYSALYAIIGNTYGAGDNATTFNLPDLRGRIPMGSGTGAGDGASGTGLPSGTALTARSAGQWGGKETHTLSTTEMPAHSHTQDPHSHSAGDNGHSHGGVPSLGTVSVPQGAYYGVLGSYGEKNTNTGYASVYVNNATATNQNTGGSGSHNNIQPYLVTNYIIKT